MKDYYSVLGVAKNATPEEIRRAFLDLAKQKHPDVLPKTENWKETTEVFRIVTIAYKTLKDRDKRRTYDDRLTAGLIDKDDIRKNHARTTFKFGLQSYKNDYFRRSYAYFQACCRLDPENPQYWSYLGLAAISSGHSLEESKTYGQKAVELHPSSAHYYINLGIIYKKAGKTSEAKKAFKAALKLDSFNLKARELLRK